MAVPSIPAGGHLPADPRGHTLGVWSLLMLPLMIVSAMVAFGLGMYLLGRRGLEGSEPMSVQGAYGWMVFALTSAIFLAPLIVGVVLGVKAYFAGARGLGLAGVLVDGGIVLAYATLGTINLLGQ